MIKAIFEAPTDAERTVGAALRKECQEIFGSTWSLDTSWRLGRAAIAALSPPEPTEGAITKLREALILSGRAVGASLSDEVSNEFLLFVPSEVALVVARLNREIAALRAMPLQQETGE